MAQDESRRIILEIDLNLKDLNTKSASLSREVTNLKAKQDDLKKSGQAGTVQFQENAAKLRELQNEYKNTQKQTDLLTKFNSAAEGSYEKLLRKQQLEQTQLKLLEGTLKRNKDGTFELSEEYKNQADKVDKAKSALINFDQGIKDGRSNVGNYSSVLKGFSGSLGAISPQLGGLSSGFSSLKGGLDTAKIGFTTLRGAIAATGIGLLVLAFVSLITYFTKTTAGADLLGKGTAALGAIVQVLVKGLAKMGELLVAAFENPQQALKDLGDFLLNNIINRFKAFGVILEGILNLNFKKVTDGVIQLGTGFTDVTSKIKNFGNEALDAAKKAAALADELDNLEVAESNFTVTSAQAEKQISKLILQSKNRSLTEQQRIDLLKEAEKIEIETNKKAIDLANERLNIEIRNNKLKQEDGDAQLKRENELRVKVLELETDSQAIREKIHNREDALLDAQNAKAEKLAKENLDRIAAEQAIDAKWASDQNALLVFRSEAQARDIDRQIQDERFSAQQRIALVAERIQKEIDAERQKNLFLLKGKEQASAEYILIQAQETEKIKEIQAKGADDEAKIAKDAEDAKIAAIKKEEAIKQRQLNSGLSSASQTAGALSALAKKGSKEAKAFAIAQATIDTYAAANAAYKSASDIPYLGWILGPAAAAAAVAAGLANVKNISKMAKGGIIGGKPHSQGGTKFYGSDGSRFEAEAGELLTVVNKKDTKRLSYLSNLNSMSGKPFFQDGGIYSPGSTYLADGGFVSRQAGQPIFDSISQVNQVKDFITSIPNPIVLVKDINTGQQRNIDVKSRANI